MNQETLVLVDDEDNEIGTDTRENCHLGKGKRHRAYTVFLLRGGKVLLQRRSQKKLLWPGAWDVSFTSHVYPGETYAEAAARKGPQELGARAENLSDIGAFVYFAPQGDHAENEFCRVLVGDLGEERVRPNPDEIMETKWAGVDELRADLAARPDLYTPWFKLSFEPLLKSKRAGR